MPTCYEVVLEIDGDDVRDLRKRAYAPAIAKPPGAALPNVIWFTTPAASQTVFAWDEDDYGLYASLTPARPAAVLRPDAEIYSALPRTRYTFGESGFGTPVTAPGVPGGRYHLANGAPVAITAGLLQRATVNGTNVGSPLNAVVLPHGFTAEFAPATKLYVWLQSPAAPGTVIASLPDDAVEITLNDLQRTMVYRYDRLRSRFVRSEP
jgi:hypothetical protein